LFLHFSVGFYQGVLRNSLQDCFENYLAVHPQILLQGEVLLTSGLKRYAYAAWIAVIIGFAVVHAMHLRADFPNHSPWSSDWAKYTDEGWYGNAAVRAHLSGNWYLAGDFNPAVALPAWPAAEWVVFAFTGVSVEAARGLAAGCFFLSLVLCYLLVCASGPRWTALLAVTLLVTNPFLYCFSRLAILEPMLICCFLAALNIAVRLPHVRRRRLCAAGVGLLFALMLLTKLTAIFLLPAIVWAAVSALRRAGEPVRDCALAAAGAAAGAYGVWLALLVRANLLADYRELLLINRWPKPQSWTWPLVSFWWSLHGALWIDRWLIPIAALFVGAVFFLRRNKELAALRSDPVFVSALLAIGGTILFMTYQNHPQPRYFTVAAVFVFIVIAQCIAALLPAAGQRVPGLQLGSLAIAAAVAGALAGGVQTLRYAARPEYTFANAAVQLAHFMDARPNGNRLLLSVSGDELSLFNHVPALCEDYGTEELPEKLAAYKPGWYAAWNDLDPDDLARLHRRYSLEQVASFPAFDDPDRNVLVLFKLHSLPGGATRDASDEADLRQPLPDDKIEVDIE
jgi:Dolichyl-phosphate-mannose-protein mannosyltransferase